MGFDGARGFGPQIPSKLSGLVPTDMPELQTQYGLPATTPYGRVVNGCSRAIDKQRTGTARQLQPGRCFLFAGVSDEISCGDVGTVQHVTMRVKLAVDNQELFSLQDSTDTAVTVVAGVLTFGGSLTGSNIYVDGVSKTAAEAGALLNDNAWHRLDFDLTSISASDVVIGMDGGTGFGNFYLAEFRLDSETATTLEIQNLADISVGQSDVVDFGDRLFLKCDDASGVVALDSSGAGKHGTITAADIAAFHDATENDQFSFQDEVGFSQAATFNGTDELITSRSNLGISGDVDLSMCCWVRLHDIPAAPEAAMGNSSTGTAGEGLFMSFNGARPTMDFWSNRVRSDDALNANQWYHIAVTKAAGAISATSCTVYVDGVAVAATLENSGDAPSIVDSAAVVGRLDATRWFDGNVADPRWYARQLGPEEVLAIAQGNEGPTDYILRYEFDGTDKFVTDLSGNNNTGDLTSSTPAVVWENTIPRDESDQTKDILGRTIQYSGQAGHDAVISSPVGTFDGSTQYIKTSDYFDGGELTVEGWFKTSASHTGTVAAAWGGAGEGSWALFITTTNIQLTTSGDGTATTAVGSSGQSINDGAWHHIAATYATGGAVKLYIDGISVASGSGNGTSLFDTPAAVTFGAYDVDNTALSYLNGQLGVWRIYDSVLTDQQVTDLYLGTDPGGELSKHEFVENLGDVVHDSSGNDRHGVLTGAEGTFRANQQDKRDTTFANGFTIGTRYVATSSESYTSSAAGDLFNAQSKFSMGGWFYKKTGEVASIGTGTSAFSTAWVRLTWFSDDRIYAEVSSTVSRFGQYNTDIGQGEWHHIAVVYDGTQTGNANRLKLYIDGTLTAFTSFTSDIPDVSHPNVGDFILGQYNSVYTNSMHSGVVFEITDWSASDITNIVAGTIPSTAYWIPAGNGTETQQGLAAFTVNGTPDQIIVPQGIMPVTVGPGVLAPGQSLDLGCGESNSAYSQQINSIHGDLTYDQADDDGANNCVYARVQATGDDRIYTFVPALTGQDNTDIEAFCS